jgi:hypothetical protein
VWDLAIRSIQITLDWVVCELYFTAMSVSLNITSSHSTSDYATRWMLRISNPDKDKRFFSSLKGPEETG